MNEELIKWAKELSGGNNSTGWSEDEVNEMARHPGTLMKAPK